MFAFQARHARMGHPVFVNGEIYGHPPWWSHLWWQWQNYGTAATISLGLALGATLLMRPRPVLGYLWAAALVPFVYLSFCTDFKLGHYYYVWQAPLTLLAAAAIGRLLAMGGWRRLAALGMLLPLVWSGATTVSEVATLKPHDYPIAAKLLRANHATDGPVVVFGYGKVAGYYLPGIPIIGVRTIASGKPVPGSVEAVIDDPAITTRYRGRQAQAYRNYMQETRPRSTRYRVDRLVIYVLHDSMAPDMAPESQAAMAPVAAFQRTR
jgi:hypothetical protein